MLQQYLQHILLLTTDTKDMKMHLEELAESEGLAQIC